MLMVRKKEVPKQKPEVFEEAIQAFQTQDYFTCEDLCRKILKAEEWHLGATLLLAKCHFNRHFYREAQLLLLRIKEKDEDNPDVKSMLREIETHYLMPMMLPPLTHVPMPIAEKREINESDLPPIPTVMKTVVDLNQPALFHAPADDPSQNNSAMMMRTTPTMDKISSQTASGGGWANPFNNPTTNPTTHPTTHPTANLSATSNPGATLPPLPPNPFLPSFSPPTPSSPPANQAAQANGQNPFFIDPQIQNSFAPPPPAPMPAAGTTVNPWPQASSAASESPAPQSGSNNYQERGWDLSAFVNSAPAQAQSQSSLSLPPASPPPTTTNSVSSSPMAQPKPMTQPVAMMPTMAAAQANFTANPFMPPSQANGSQAMALSPSPSFQPPAQHQAIQHPATQHQAARQFHTQSPSPAANLPLPSNPGVAMGGRPAPSPYGQKRVPIWQTQATNNSPIKGASVVNNSSPDYYKKTNG